MSIRAALRSGRPLRFDPGAQRCVGDEDLQQVPGGGTIGLTLSFFHQAFVLIVTPLKPVMETTVKLQ